MLVIHDHRLPYEYIEALSGKISCDAWYSLNAPVDSKVYSSVSSHPDIYFFQLDHNILIHAPAVPEDLLQGLKKNGMDLIKGESDPGSAYPETARYNAVRVGRMVFHDLRCTDPAILKKARETGLRTIHVAQGYTRCSVLLLNDRALMTSDRGIARAAVELGIEVLLIAPGHISLPGERHGFIGGAGCRLPGDSVVLLGDIAHHPDAVRIKGFFEEQGVNLISLPGLTLYDAGGLMILKRVH